MVSVIITTYNRRAFLPEAVASVFAQSYNDFELIVIDDGSTDGSVEVFRGLSGPVPVQYHWKENGGVSSARNLGLSIARGDLVAFLDVDDLWKPGKLATQVEAMAGSGAPLCYTDEIWLRNGAWLNQGKRHRKYSGRIYERCLPLCIISPSSALISRSVLDEVGLFDESLPVCEDYDMWLRICSRFSVLFVPKPLIVKRGGHDDQLSRSYEVMDRYRIRALVKILESGALDEAQRQATIVELEKKCRVVAQGASRRGRKEEAEYYRGLPGHYE
jgi:glycosyltransferase involved in cell wall biosynthesis